MSSARMRALGGEVVDLELVAGAEGPTLQVQIPMFGVLLVGEVQSEELIARLGPGTWRALLVQPDSRGYYSDQSRKVEYEATRTESGDVEVELLPNTSGEERLVVVVTP